MKKLISIIILCIFIIACGSNGNTGDDGKYIINGVAVSKKNREVTPQGAVVYSVNGSNSQFNNQIDSGLMMAFNNSRLSGWSVNMEYSIYTIFIPAENCIPSPQQGTMSFKVRSSGGDYDGSIYDYDGMEKETDPRRLAAGYVHKANGKVLLYASEMVTEMNQSSMSMIICPGPDATNANNNGAEHYLAASNDGDYYELTKTHLSIPHPILPKPAGSVRNKNIIKPIIKNEVLINLVK